MNYKLFIEGANGKIAITEKNIINKVDINVFMIEKSVNDHSDQLFNNLTICGRLSSDSKKETLELFEWSKKTDKADAYRTVSLQIYDGNELIRDYYLKEMYCVSYKELFAIPESDESDAGSAGSFILVMKQKKGAIDTIVVES